MEKELITNLTDEENIILIYSTTKYSKNADKKYLNYTIVCDLDSVISNFNLCKKIIATMEIIKELVSKYNICFSYKIKTCNEFDREVSENHQKFTHELATAQILHCKDQYIDKLIEESKSKRRG